MKKTSLIILTLVACCSVTMSATAQTDSLVNHYPPEFLYEVDRMNSTPPNTNIKKDSTVRDTVTQVVYVQQPVYNYYYRSRFWNGWYRIFFPRRYYTVIHRPGYVPRRIRRDYHGPTSHKRGGFGRSGRAHAQSN